ncbi:hypothetical protein ACJX0J_021680, partial [Zea mays]
QGTIRFHVLWGSIVQFGLQQPMHAILYFETYMYDAMKKELNAIIGHIEVDTAASERTKCIDIHFGLFASLVLKNLAAEFVEDLRGHGKEVPSIHEFSKPLINMMKAAGWDLDGAFFHQFLAYLLLSIWLLHRLAEKGELHFSSEMILMDNDKTDDNLQAFAHSTL